MSYEDFYGLKEQPFSNAPDNRFFFSSSIHSEAMKRIQHVISTDKGLAVILGEIGTGKTTLARKMLEMYSTEEYDAALLVIIHSAITAEWLLRKVALQLGVENPPTQKVEILSVLAERLFEIHDQGRRAVVLVDEANMLQSKEIMEEFRGLLNLELPGKKLINFVLLGLPELDEHMSLDEPLAQRVATKVTLHSLKYDGTREYILYRLKVAGRDQPVFDEESIKLIFGYSRGTPRLINAICDNALFEGYLLKKQQISTDLIQEVVFDLGLKKPVAG